MRSSSRISPTQALLAALAAVAALAVTTGVSYGSPDESDDSSSPLDIPLLSDGIPDGCSVTSSNPKRGTSCNEDGGNGRDGADGEVHGQPSEDTDVWYVDEEEQEEPDVNGAPGGWGTRRALVAPGAHAPGQPYTGRYEGSSDSD